MRDAWDRHWRKLKRTSLRRNVFVGSILSALIVFAISAVSAVSLMVVASDAAQFPFSGNAINSIGSFWAIAIGAVLGAGLVIALLYLRLLSNDMYEALSEPWTTPERRRATLAFWALVLIVFVIPIAIHLYVTNSVPSGGLVSSWWAWVVVEFFTKYTGGLVGFTLAVLSIMAFYIAIQQLKDFQSRISSFSELLERIIKLGETTTRDEKMHIIAYTPAVGYLAQNRMWTKVLAALTDVDEKGDGRNRCRTRVLTQDMESLKAWHAQFVGRKTKRLGGRAVTEEDVANADKEAELIKGRLQGLDPNAYREVKFNTLPGYYCFFTGRRAIIVAPLFLPLTATAKPMEPTELLGLPPPHMIGFETGDRGIIDYLFDQFEYIEKSDEITCGA